MLESAGVIIHVARGLPAEEVEETSRQEKDEDDMAPASAAPGCHQGGLRYRRG
jgi:hypothetical protein